MPNQYFISLSTVFSTKADSYNPGGHAFLAIHEMNEKGELQQINQVGFYPQASITGIPFFAKGQVLFEKEKWSLNCRKKNDNSDALYSVSKRLTAQMFSITQEELTHINQRLNDLVERSKAVKAGKSDKGEQLPYFSLWGHNCSPTVPGVFQYRPYRSRLQKYHKR